MLNLAVSKYEKIKSQNLTLWMNNLLVVYAFLIPVSGRGKTTIFVFILLLFLIRGNFKYYLSKAYNNRVVQAFLLFYLVHVIWLFGTENFTYAKLIFDDMKYLLFPLLFLSFFDERYTFRVISAFIIGMFYSEILSYFIYFDVLPYKLELFNLEIYKAYDSNNPTPFLNHVRYTVFLSFVVALLLKKAIGKK